MATRRYCRPWVSFSPEGKPHYSKELRHMNKVALLWVVAVAALTFGAATTATTQRKSQAYALSAAQVVEDGTTRALRYVWERL